MSGASVSSTSTKPVYRVAIKDRGSTYASRLYDVDGFVLMDDDGNFLNVFNATMKQYLDEQKIRAIRSIKEGYLYFIQHDEQRRRFKHERVYGSEFEHMKYHVYRDKEDYAPLLSVHQRR